jgi:hypothetical protein
MWLKFGVAPSGELTSIDKLCAEKRISLVFTAEAD